jgi:hypothetical protein
VLIAQILRFTHICCQLFVVVAELSQHIKRHDIVDVVVKDALMAVFWPIERKSRTADLAYRSA